MPKRTKAYHDFLMEELSNPQAIARYLNAALEDSDEMFLKALRNVAEAQQMARVAEQAGVQRESLYRMLCESGNPTYKSLFGILRALELRFRLVIEPLENQPISCSETVGSNLQETAHSLMGGAVNTATSASGTISKPISVTTNVASTRGRLYQVHPKQEEEAGAKTIIFFSPPPTTTYLNQMLVPI